MTDQGIAQLAAYLEEVAEPSIILDDDYRILKLAQAPQIETHIVASTRHPAGVGEPGTPPLAPALANALFALTGTRLREMPLKMPA